MIFLIRGYWTNLLETTLVTPNPESHLLLLRAHDGSFGRHQDALVIMQQDGKRIVISRCVDLPLRANKRCDAVGKPEQMHGLVQQVRAQVVDGSSTGDHLVLPLVSVCRGLNWTVSVKMGVVFYHTAQRAILDQLGQGQEISVPAAV